MSHEADPNSIAFTFTRYKISLKGNVVIHYTPENKPLDSTPNVSHMGDIKPSQAMLEGGLRFNAAHAISKIADPDAPVMRHNRLQIEVKDLSDMVLEQEDTEMPEVAVDKAEDNVVSYLNMDATWKYGNYAIHAGQKYIAFQGPKILKQYSSDESVIYTLPIDHPQIVLVFIESKGFMDELTKEAENNSTDLFFKVDSLLKSLEETNETVDELWIPCFSKNISSQVPWVNGLILSQRQEVTECSEQLYVEISADTVNPGSLVRDTIGSDALTDDFILVGLHRQISENFDVPLFTCYVKKENWIS